MENSIQSIKEEIKKVQDQLEQAEQVSLELWTFI